MTLPAGKYLFRLADSGGRDVVQVLSANGKTPYAMFFTKRAQRFEATSEPEVRFLETAAGMPAAVKTWWYPGERIGYEFVYPKEQARLLAKGTGQPVLTTYAETIAPTPPNRPLPELAWVFPTGKETKLGPEPALPPIAPAEPSQVGQVAPSTLEIPAPALQARANLPKTGSAIPLVGTVGLVLLLGAAFIKALRLMRA